MDIQHSCLSATLPLNKALIEQCVTNEKHSVIVHSLLSSLPLSFAGLRRSCLPCRKPGTLPSELTPEVVRLFCLTISEDKMPTSLPLPPSLSPSRFVLSEHTRWCRQGWQEVDCSSLLGTMGRQCDMMCSLPVVTHSWDVYQHTLTAIENMHLMAPLVEGLRRCVLYSLGLQPRWKHVVHM